MSATAESSDVVVYTSLPPKLRRMARGKEIGEAYQHACIKSWRKLSSEIVTLNSSSEIRELSARGFEISFLEIVSERPRIEDFVQAAKSSGKKIAAIVNADCLLAGTRPTIEASIEAAANGIVLFERLNVHADNICPTGVPCSGFDLFLFDTGPLPDLKLDDRFTIGSPWWDYYFPIAYEAAGGTLKSLPGPTLIHLDHPRAFSQKSWDDNGRFLHSYLLSGQIAASKMPVSAAIRSAMGGDWYASAARCFQELQSASKVEIDDEISVLSLLLLGNIEKFGNFRIYEEARTAQRPFAAISRYLKWRSSLVAGTLSAPLFKRFAERMRRRAAKNAPLTDIFA